MHKIISLLAIALGITLQASQPEPDRQKLLDAVTIIKPLQEIIKSYLHCWEEVPDTLNSMAYLRTITFSPEGEFESVKAHSAPVSNIAGTIEKIKREIKTLATQYEFQDGSAKISVESMFLANDMKRTICQLGPVAFSADHRIMAVLSNSLSRTQVKFYDLTEPAGKQEIALCEYPRHLAFNTFALSENGKLAAIAAMQYQSEVDTTNFKLDQRQHAHAIGIYDVATKKVIRRIYTPARISAVAISPDNSMLAVADRAGILSIYDMVTGSILQSHKKNHYELTCSPSFSPDGNFLVSSEELPYPIIKIRHMETGKIEQLLHKVNRVKAVSISLNAIYIAISGEAPESQKLYKNQALEIELANTSNETL